MAKKRTMLDALESNAKVFERALEKSNDRLSGNTPVNEDMAVYMKLKNEDFSKLAEEFGRDSVFQYIKDMEADRLRSL